MSLSKKLIHEVTGAIDVVNNIQLAEDVFLTDASEIDFDDPASVVLVFESTLTRFDHLTVEDIDKGREAKNGIIVETIDGDIGIIFTGTRDSEEARRHFLADNAMCVKMPELAKKQEQPNKSTAVETELMSEGFLKVKRLKLNTPKLDGTGSFEQVREVVEQNDSVFILPYDPKTQKCLVVKQHRPGAINTESTVVLEPIAGRLDKNKSPVETVLEEVQEETGFDLYPSAVVEAGKAFSSPGGSTEVCHLFLAECDLSQVPKSSFHGLASEGEDIEACCMFIGDVNAYKENISLQLVMLANLARVKVISAQ